MTGDRKIESRRRDDLLAGVLAANPDAVIAAISPAGLFVPLPETLADTGLRAVAGPASALEMAIVDDHQTLIDTWHRFLAEGAANCLVHLRSAPDRQARLYLIDQTHRHGVFICVIAGVAGDLDDPAGTQDSVRPRHVTVRKDVAAVIIQAPPEVELLLGWTPEELVGRRTLELVHPDDRERAIASWMDLLNTPPGTARRVRLRHLHKDGHPMWFEITNHNMFTDPDRPGVLAEMLDISDEMAAQEAVRAGEQLLRRLTETLPLAIIQIDADQRIVYLNDRAARFHGAKAGEVLGESRLDHTVAADRQAVDDAVAGVLRSGEDADLEYGHYMAGRFRRIRANLRALSDGPTITGAILCFADMTEDARMREELHIRATYDQLTSCHNRAATLAALKDAVSSSQTGTAVAFFDLDGFKQVNDRYGHAAGDRMLSQVGARLREAARAGDVVGRLGGDEFVVICRDVADEQETRRVGARLLAALRSGSVEVGEGTVPLRASLGLAWARPGTTEPEDLIARADAEMYAAKNSTRLEGRTTELHVFEVSQQVASGHGAVAHQ